MARLLEENRQRLFAANRKDLEAARQSNLSPAAIDRLTITGKTVDSMARSLREVAALPDPVGEVLNEWTPPVGVTIRKIRQPIGVILVIYESRPNVTADAAGLCLKSGNASILRGGKEAINSSLAIADCLREALRTNGIPETAIQVIDTTERAVVGALLKSRERIDLVIPRGGKSLIERVVTESTIPVIKHFEGICHTYVDTRADLAMAQEVCFNAKVQRPGVCNAMETLLVHRDVAESFLPAMLRRFRQAGVELRGDPKVRRFDPSVLEATEADWRTEYLDLILSVKIVDNLDEAIDHVNRYGSRHSDSIITNDPVAAEKFTRLVDSAAVMVNCSTRLHDGGVFGMGAEIGISTDKIHARGPMALPELTTYKYVVTGTGQIRS
jgi:glutamate-5-semialdehyde dehydrogenase